MAGSIVKCLTELTEVALDIGHYDFSKVFSSCPPCSCIQIGERQDEDNKVSRSLAAVGAVIISAKATDSWLRANTHHFLYEWLKWQDRQHSQQVSHFHPSWGLSDFQSFLWPCLLDGHWPSQQVTSLLFELRRHMLWPCLLSFFGQHFQGWSPWSEPWHRLTFLHVWECQRTLFPSFSPCVWYLWNSTHRLWALLAPSYEDD